MKIDKKKFYSRLFIIFLFLQLYLTSFKVNIFLQIGGILLYFFFERPVISKSFLRRISPLFLLICVGFLGTLINKFSFSQISKDFFHFLKPILGITIGYFFYRKIGDKERFIKNIIYAGFISAIIHLIIVFFFSNFSTGNVSSIRQFSRDNFLELVSVFFLVTYSRFFQKKIELRNYKLILIILLLSCFLYLSRTMFLTTIVFFISIFGFSKITIKTVKIVMLFLLVISLFYGYLFSVKIERNEPGIEGFLYKIKIAPSEIFKTKIDRENHRDLWDHWRGYEAKRAIALMKDNPSSWLFGSGFGSMVNLKFKAPLSGNKEGMKFISELHNGYVYLLYKTGIIGLLIYLYFIFTLYKEIYKKMNFETVYISSIGLIFFITTLTITGIYNNRDIFVFILGSLLLFNQKKKESS